MNTNMDTGELAGENLDLATQISMLSTEELRALVDEWIKTELNPRQARMIRNAAKARAELRKKDEAPEVVSDSRVSIDPDKIVTYLKDPAEWTRRINELAVQGGMEMEAAEVYSFKDWFSARGKSSKAARTAA